MRFLRKISLPALLILALSAPAWALTLDEAKQQGLVGEATSGYLAPVGAANAEVTALIQHINSERRTRYAQIAQKNGTSLSAVEALAAKKAIDETAAGRYVQAPDGSWKRK